MIAGAHDLIVQNTFNVFLMPSPAAWLVLEGSPYFDLCEGMASMVEGWIHYPIVKAPNAGGFLFQRLGHEVPTLLKPTDPMIPALSDRIDWSPSIDKRPIWPLTRWDGDDPVLIQYGTIDLPIPVEPVVCPPASTFGLMFWNVQANSGQPWDTVTRISETRFRVTGELIGADRRAA